MVNEEDITHGKVYLKEWNSGTKYELSVNDEDTGCIIADVIGSGPYETHEINLNYDNGNSMQVAIYATSYWEEFDEEHFDETIASLDCSYEELIQEIKEMPPDIVDPYDDFDIDLTSDPDSGMLFSVLIHPYYDAVTVEELPNLDKLNLYFREMKKIFDSHKKKK